ncbi:hypothetical protein [Saccharothrix variisporea]|nr:hypothetical protein [Saccharothrix variisporea]
MRPAFACDDGAVIIPGYLDAFEPPLPRSTLVDATDQLHTALFWPAFLSGVGGARTAPSGFGADPTEVAALDAEWLRPDRWPVISLPVAGGRLHVVQRNLEDESGVDYVLEDGSPPALDVAAVEGNFRGPGLSWAEAAQTAAQAVGVEAARRLLLLLPAVGDVAASTRAAHALVTAAVKAVGCSAALAPRVAEELLTSSARFWGAHRWDEVEGIPVNLGPHSTRHPARQSLSELRRIAAAFAPLTP